MSERIPSLDVFHPVINIGRDYVAGIGRKLLDNGVVDYDETERRSAMEARRKTVRKLLRPARLLRAEVVIHSELLRLQKRAGITGVDEEHIDELSAHLRQELDKARPPDEGRSTSTLPARVEALGRQGFILSIAASRQLIREREVAKSAIVEFYGLDEAPDHTWFNDGRVTRAWLARSSGTESNELLFQLEKDLTEHNSLLPERTIFGELTIQPNPHRD